MIQEVNLGTFSAYLSHSKRIASTIGS